MQARHTFEKYSNLAHINNAETEIYTMNNISKPYHLPHLYIVP